MNEFLERHSMERRQSDQATLDDLYYCYRLLLHREPDEEGWDYWRGRLATEQFTYSKLVAYFCRSREYVAGARARGLRLVEFDGFDLYAYEHDWDIGENLVQTGQYEPHVTAFLGRRLERGMTFIDVGANIGYFTVMAAKLVGDTGKVIAIECNPRNCEVVYMSLHRNGLHNVLVYPFAVSDAQKLMSFSWGFSNGFVQELSEEDESAVIVPAVTLDYILEKEPRVDIIKMDIEGSEAKACEGMRRILERDHPIVLLEFFPALIEQNSGSRGEQLLDSFFASGYHASILQPERDEPTQASTTEEVMGSWRKRSEVVGDESKAYLDLAFIHRGK